MTYMYILEILMDSQGFLGIPCDSYELLGIAIGFLRIAQSFHGFLDGFHGRQLNVTSFIDLGVGDANW